MKSKPDITERDLAKQMKDYERQPKVNRDLENLEDQSEKSVGRDKVATNRKIKAKAGQTGKGR